MITLVLSTPRSGSTFYADSIKHLSQNKCDCLQEWFSMMYESSYMDHTGEYSYVRTTPYKEGRYYLTIKNNLIVREYSPREDSYLEYKKWINYLSSTSNNIIIHEHINRLPHEWITDLIQLSSKCVYVVRNQKEQLSSLAIAKYTGVYAITADRIYCVGDTTHANEYITKKFQHSIINYSHIKSAKIDIDASNYIAKRRGLEIVNYESVQRASSTPTKKLFDSSYERLCESDKQIIDEICLLN